MIVRILIVAALILSPTHALSITMSEYIFLNPLISYTPVGTTAYLAIDYDARSAITLQLAPVVGSQSQSLTKIISEKATEVFSETTPREFGEAIHAAQLAFIQANLNTITTHYLTYFVPVNMPLMPLDPSMDSEVSIDGYYIYSYVSQIEGTNILEVLPHTMTYNEPLKGLTMLFLFPTDMRPDTDNDGVFDSNDNCPFDADNDIDDDGICGDVDNCPADANADQANFDNDVFGNVCDVDDDNDGLDDEFDQCIDTILGDVVDVAGCSIQQVCPCDNNWRNHGGYMKCIARTSKYFLDDGLISFDEKNTIVSSEAKTKCGSKK